MAGSGRGLAGDRVELSCEGLEVGFPGRPAVLRGASLRLGSVSKLALLGRNGAGKSTLLHCLLGLLRPQKGQVLVDGKGLDCSRSGLRRHRQRVGLLLQNPDDQLLAPMVGDDVALGPRNLGLSESEVGRRVREALELFELEELAEYATSSLSNGQKKRVALAGLFSMSPEVVLLDEPSAGLDPGGVLRLRQALDLLTERGVRLLLSTHDLDFAYQWSSELALLDGGVIVAQAEPDQVFTQFGDLCGRPLLYELKQALAGYGQGLPRAERQQLLDRVKLLSENCICKTLESRKELE